MNELILLSSKGNLVKPALSLLTSTNVPKNRTANKKMKLTFAYCF